MMIRIPFATSNEFMAWLQKIQDFIEFNGFNGANYKPYRVTWLSDEDDRGYTAITRRGISRSDEYFQNRCVVIRVNELRLRFTLAFSDRDSNYNYNTPEEAYAFITKSLLSGKIQRFIDSDTSEIPQPTELILASMPTHIADLVKQRVSRGEELLNNQFFALRLFSDIDSYKEICKSGDSQAWLVNRFCWSETREGQSFWSDIHTAFEGNGHLGI
jgi:hypothetical protein